MIDPLSDDELRRTFAGFGITSCCPQMMAVLQRAHKAAKVSDVTVLIQGETGTGKQLLAEGIHALDYKRRESAFVTVHSSTITETLAESELFGHRRGAFSGAVAERKGLFQAAEHGTILLDDVNDLPFHLQPKLLEVIQRGVVRPIGSDREVKIDVRIIAACNHPLEPLVREGRFRSDLFHRLNVVKLCLPPLRERAADLAAILLVLAERHSRLYKPIYEIDPALVALIQCRAFPGNVRELENAVQRMLFLKNEGTSLGVVDWTAQADQENTYPDSDPMAEAARAVLQAIEQRGIPFAQAMHQIERYVLAAATKPGLETRKAIANRLHTSERTLYYKMRAHQLNLPSAS